jgi:predicted nucleotidyltransferase
MKKASKFSQLNLEKLKLLQGYFKKESEVSMAFLFGSQAKGLAGDSSDWDVGVYFTPREYLELEKEGNYPGESKIWADLVDILQTDVDFLVLNRARPSLVFSILNSGFPLVVKDRKLYLRLLSKASYEAVDFWDFVYDFWKIRERAKSLSPVSPNLLS